MPTQREKITNMAMEILENHPNGIRYADWVRKISEALPDVKLGTIQGTIYEIRHRIDKNKIKDVVRPEKGLYIFRKYLKEKDFAETEYSEETKTKEVKEEDFYQAFADYLVNELEECTKAVPLGGNRFQDRWGTPDVIGTYRVLGIGHIQPPIDVICAEIKTNINQLITAFGQVCSYKLFSHKVYLVIPKDSNSVDIKRIESLCLKFGIGLILFDRNNRENPKFEILARAVKSEPDYFYLNKYLKLIEDVASELF